MWNTRWTPSGQILFESQNKIYRINPDGTNLHQLADPGRNWGYLAFSRDGKKAVFDWEERIDGKAVWSVSVLDIETGKIKKIADVNPASLDWSPDGRHIVYSQENFIWEPHGNGLALIRKAFYCVICDKNGRTIRRLNVPKNLKAASFAWIDGGKSILFTGWERVLNEVPPKGRELPPTNIYKYNLITNEMVQITKHPGDDNDVDWISDDVLPVTPRGKKKVTWGALKQ